MVTLDLTLDLIPDLTPHLNLDFTQDAPQPSTAKAVFLLFFNFIIRATTLNYRRRYIDPFVLITV